MRFTKGEWVAVTTCRLDVKGLGNIRLDVDEHLPFDLSLLSLGACLLLLHGAGCLI
jgi:hypothetical protein